MSALTATLKYQNCDVTLMVKRVVKKGSIFEKEKHKHGEEQTAPEREEFLEPEEHAESSDEFESKLHVGEKEEDVYTEEGREELVEEDGAKAWEEAWAEGAEGKGSLGNCGHCGKTLSERKTVERRIKGKIVFFCSEKCAKAGKS